MGGGLRRVRGEINQSLKGTKGDAGVFGAPSPFDGGCIVIIILNWTMNMQMGQDGNNSPMPLVYH